MTQVHVGEPRTRVLDRDALQRATRRIAHEIREAHADLDLLLIAGIREGGVDIAGLIARALSEISAQEVAVAALRVDGFRDDRPRVAGADDGRLELLRGHRDVAGSITILVDDVVQTGRTLRAAFDAVASLGRPDAIEAAVMIDRGGREVPVRPNYVGKNLPVPASSWVEIVSGPADEAGVYMVSR
jgi:pyrimidine operon attenuation protein/uracil phosphoribosyltransferase